ncbi:hypothetical protein V3C99_013045 [Haemonchus contortus]|uniref:Uncharacterized protein n=1 Tax=Haemonchus contortus TaxID=6289 RepID=A0A7I4Y0W2_HAECO
MHLDRLAPEEKDRKMMFVTFIVNQRLTYDTQRIRSQSATHQALGLLMCLYVCVCMYVYMCFRSQLQVSSME